MLSRYLRFKAIDQCEIFRFVSGADLLESHCHERFDFIFLDVDMPERIRRIKARNGEAGLKMFIEKWIPMVELYFETYDIKNRCDMSFSTD
jgi:CheY-like chemotaxis protein